MKALDEVDFPLIYDKRETKLRRGSPEGPAYKAGDVLRRKDHTHPRKFFGDWLIIGFDKYDDARLVRPFAMALGPGLANPATSVSFETLDSVDISTLDEYYKVVGTGMYLERKKEE